METTIDYTDAIKSRMKVENMPALAIRSFMHYYRKLVEGDTGMIAERDITPVRDLPDLEKLDDRYSQIGSSVLSQLVMLKLNGGLGTSMGLQRAKSLLTVKPGYTFLDIIARQAIHWDIPFVLMNSFSTAQDSRDHLAAYSKLRSDVPIDFLQHKVPKISQVDLGPVDWEKDPSLEWCPPGHGDIYTALITTGMLDTLIEKGFKYVFVSNGDNLGARLDLALLGYFCDEQIPFMMEVADRTPADRKGGHLAYGTNGNLLLRESAQCPDEDRQAFQDISRHRFFNTNNLWIRLDALKKILDEKDGILDLPMIRNSKTVDPRDPESTPVYQLETAMGAAIEVFPDAGAIRVPRSRFAPVKTTNQLLAVRSDAYRLKEDYSIVLAEERRGVPCIVELDPACYKTVDQIDERFPHGPPSLLACHRLTVKGDVYFGKDIVCSDEVDIENPSDEAARIPDGELITGRYLAGEG